MRSTIVLTNASYQSMKYLYAGARQVAIVGNAVDTDYYPFALSEPRPNTLVYSGALTFHANYDAMQWFLGEILPRVQASNPAVTMQITGSYDGIDLSALPQGRGVTLTGYLYKPWQGERDRRYERQIDRSYESWQDRAVPPLTVVSSLWKGETAHLLG